MCCFSGPVQSVSNTRIFARGEGGGGQILVYRMDLATDAAVAMVLPVPVPAGAAENAVAFIDLKAYPGFFADLEAAWPLPTPAPAKTRSAGPLPAPAPAPLAVQNVGDFEASFVPGVADFARLDPRFRLPAGTWDRLPQYRTYGFVVFKLKPGRQSVQPMAFRFTRADAGTLFFPTVHIHDGAIHAQAEFDHELFLQARPEERLRLHDFEESALIARQVMRLDRCQGIVAADAHIHRLRLHGRRDNGDILVGRG